MNALKNLLSLLLFLCIFTSKSVAYNIRPLSKTESLSNNSIESLHQDITGRLWIGTCDGINIFNGREIEIYQPSDSSKTLSGNIIDNIIETEDNIIWIQTYYGLNMLNRNTNTVKHFTDFKPNLYMTKDKNNILFVIQEDNSIHYFDSKEETFGITTLSGISIENILQFIVDKDNRLWIIGKDGLFVSYNIIYHEEGILFHENYRLNLLNKIMYAFYSNNDILFVNENKQLYSFNLHDLSQVYLFNLAPIIGRKGDISSMIRSSENIFIAYKTNGIQILRKKEDASYEVETIPINCGVFSLLKDKYQDIVWIGTDGQGVYSYSNDIYTIRTVSIKDYIPQIGKPIRTIFKDNQNSLWIGTKGDGIIKINEYGENVDLSQSKIERLTTSNSLLKDDAVYCIRKSEHNILWIGTENGLNYYSLHEKKMKQVALYDKDVPVIYIHDIYEQDSLLWISTVGMGVIKARVRWHQNQPTIEVLDRLVLHDGNMVLNYFFSIYPQNDSIIWLANRGAGALKLETNSMKYEQITFGRNNHKTLDEVLSISQLRDKIYFGTSSGLIEYTAPDNYTIFNNNDGFSNNTIHDILKENDNSLWLSTNRGLINYKPNEKIIRSYNLNNGLGINEYSDGAAYNDINSGILYFGGVDGFVSVLKNRNYSNEYMPKLTFDKLSIFGEQSNIKDYLIEGVLELKFTQNFITIEVNAIDFLDAYNYSFQYKIEGATDQWIDNGASNIIPITNLNHGKYVLNVRYVNKNIGITSPEYILNIQILPPWYLSTLAYVIYMIVIFGILFFVYKYLDFVRTKRKKRFLRKLELKHKEEVHESKLIFFTSIAHEFCTPLTLIHGPCSQILNLATPNSKTKKYADIILRNTERLNSLVQDLIEFRKIETSNSLPRIEELDVTEIVNNVIASFKEFASSHDAKFYKLVPSNLKWNSNKNYIVTIVSNLLSNAFKYMCPKGSVEIEVKIEDGKEMIIRISNTGKGIEKEHIDKVFDRYSIFDTVDRFSQRTWSRHGLGLAIVNAMVTNLEGNIKVESTLNEWTHFTLSLPLLESNKKMLDYEISSMASIPPPFIDSEFPTVEALDKSKPTILAIDDEAEILWFYSDIFSPEYNVITVSAPAMAPELLDQFHPDIILCDINMPQLNGIELVNMIKSDKQTSHIPLVIVSAKHDSVEQIKGVNAGAELFITKPFNVDYLRASVSRLISRKRSLKEYFSSPMSAYILDEGMLIHQDDDKVLREIKQLIIENITNKELNVAYIAKQMNLSTRSLYRKLSDTNNPSISDMIRDCRLRIAENLLLHTKKTIGEIINESGFNNRVSFYKAFSNKHNCSPTEFSRKQS